MNISSLSATYTLTEQISYSTTSSAQDASQTDDAQSTTIAPQTRHGGHQHGIFKSFLDTLQQLGLVPNGTSLSTLNAANSTTASAASNSDGNATSSADTIQQDVQAFMHALFQALHAQSAKQATTAANDAVSGKTSGQYSGFQSRIAQLAQSLSASSGSTSDSGSGGTSDLDSAFQQLIRDLNTSRQNSATASSKQPVSLQSFLQAWAGNMSDGGTSAIGNSISIAA